jgi:tetratricopeptide (TPR) repeat protein
LLLAGCSSDPSTRKHAYLTSGDKYYQFGKYQEAVIQFRNALQIDPRFAEAHWQLARAYMKLQNTDAAYHELANTVTLEPNNADAQLELASLLLARGQFKEAQAAAEEALKLVSDSARAHSILGERFLLTHDREKALEELQKAVNADPSRVAGYTALGAAYLAAGQTANGESTFKKGVEANPRSVEAHEALAELWLSERKLAEAEAEMRTAVGLDAHAVAPRLFLARILQMSGRPNDAEKIYIDLKKIAPNDPQAYQALGLFYCSSGQKEMALAEFRSLLASKPKDATVRANLTEVLIDLNHTKEARDLNQELLHQNPGNPQALLADGRLLLADSKYQEAAAALQNATQSDPNCARCYYFLGAAQAAIGHNDLAKGSLARARQLAPQMSEATLMLAQLDMRGGDADEAFKLADSILKADPNLVSAYVTEARALISKGDLPKAEAQLEEALKRDSTNLAAVAMWLNLAMRQGKTAAAATRIARLVEQNPQNVGLHVLLGVAYLNLKDLDKSAAHAPGAGSRSQSQRRLHPSWQHRPSPRLHRRSQA